ncbi:hypothetical protein WR25_19256 [Diploscapter pachys]|uniref:Uncharacterized protein n=1 Tax=Diploscapter pachys TaxID=2018661 RepID=A0A2A2L7Z8_9BILA|nr:hypothetical protein WR25_19256 [Diploscapter pachys]
MQTPSNYGRRSLYQPPSGSASGGVFLPVSAVPVPAPIPVTSPGEATCSPGSSVPHIVLRRPLVRSAHMALNNRHSYHAGASSEFNLFNQNSRPGLIRLGSFEGQPSACSFSPVSTPVEDPLHRQRHSTPCLVPVSGSGPHSTRKRYSATFGLLGSLTEEMNDRGIGSGIHPTDTQDSPRGSDASLGSLKREDDRDGGRQMLGRPTAQYQPHSVTHMIPQASIPMTGQVLVDPNTGQHYIIPQPFYSAPAQHLYYPAPQPSPLYFPYAAAAPQPIPAPIPFPTTSSQPPLQRHLSSTPPRHHPHSHYAAFESDWSSLSKADLDSVAPQSPLLFPQQPHHQSTYSTPSTYSTTSFAQQYRSQQHRGSPNSQPEDPENGRDVVFRRDASARSSNEMLRNDQQFGQQQPVNSGSLHSAAAAQRKDERTPLFGGPPPWWGREHEDSLTDVETRRPAPRPPMHSGHAHSTVSDTESSRQRHQPPARPVRMDIDFESPSLQEEQKPKVVPPTPLSSRAVRMDIDLSTLSSTPTQAPPPSATASASASACSTHGSLQNTPSIDSASSTSGSNAPSSTQATSSASASISAPLPKVASAPTAFTIAFDNPSEPVSLQDAARKSIQARKLLNRRIGATQHQNDNSRNANTQQPQPKEQQQPSNKQYLLNKLLQNEGGSEFTANVSERRSDDVASEAGTYVIDTSSRPTANLKKPNRIVENSDESTETSDSSSEEEEDKEKTPQPTGRDEMLAGLARLRQMAGVTKPPPAPVTSVSRPTLLPPSISKRTSLGQSSSSSSAGGITRSVLPSSPSAHSPLSNIRPSTTGHPPTRLSRQPLPSPAAASSLSSSSNPFRRGDGGRFSMKGGSSPQQAPKRPPFRAGLSGGRMPGIDPMKQHEQEMNAWLRRKDYNPMKAAAEAKRAKELKERGDNFISNRSISFHVQPGGVMTKRNQRQPELIRNRSQESLAREEAEYASQKVIAEYSRGVVQDINRLSKQQRTAGDGKQMSGLQKAVDMLSQKCKKSIELIRNQNKGCLSVSVEDLLAAAAEPPRVGETLDEQLDRLSDAFDAVQRYLEQYSIEDDDMKSAVTNYSGFSFRSSQGHGDDLMKSLLSRKTSDE